MSEGNGLDGAVGIEVEVLCTHATAAIATGGSVEVVRAVVIDVIPRSLKLND